MFHFRFLVSGRADGGESVRASEVGLFLERDRFGQDCVESSQPTVGEGCLETGSGTETGNTSSGSIVFHSDRAPKLNEFSRILPHNHLIIIINTFKKNNNNIKYI